MSIDEIRPLFGRVAPEWSSPPPQTTALAPFLYYVHGGGNDRSALRVIATDFHSNTFHTIKSRHQLEDLGKFRAARNWNLRDNIGIGGSWSEFVNYLTTSLKSGDVKLIMDGVLESGGAASAKLTAQKAKGMPRILFSLAKLVDGAASEAMANLSLDLHKEFKDVRNSLTEEQESKSQLARAVAAEKEKNATLQKQLDMMMYPRKHKSHKINDKNGSDSTSVMVSQGSPDKHADPNLRKGTTRVVPAFRRSKVRGAILHDTEDDA